MTVLQTESKSTLVLIRDIINHVKSNMVGRIAEQSRNVELMAKTTLIDGNHLEIGTLHGGSAIVVALLKKELGYSGEVFCIDPLDGYYMETKYQWPVDWVSKVRVTPDIIHKNEDIFGVKLNIIQSKSIPFPIDNETFTTAYIDGNHEDNIPVLDFINCSKCVTKFITFDNCEYKYPHVRAACLYAETIWRPYKREGIICTVRK